MTGPKIIPILQSHQFFFSNEKELQNGIEIVLKEYQIDYEREKNLEPYGRIDFLCQRVGIEVKIKSPLMAVLRQLQGYAQHPQIDALILITSYEAHHRAPETIGGIPLYCIKIIPGAF
jgi:hypothetical protein